jgi:type I restriction enzyme S subunit
VAIPSALEQRAIAMALSDVDALLGGLDRLIAKKRQLKQAAMQQLLTGQTRLPGFSGEWEVKRLPSLATIAQGQVDPRVASYRSMCLIGPEHVESGTGKLLTRRTALEQGAISGKYLFKKGDVVYGKINPYLRKAFLADFDGLCSADMYPLHPVEGVAPGFLLAIILGREFSTYSESVSVRSGMPKINREEMAGFSTKVPKAPDEQSAIAAVLYDMDTELTAMEARRDKTRDLKQAMMQELLTGKTRLVPAGGGHA